MSKHLIFDRNVNDSKSFKTICSESSKYRTLKIHILKIVPLFTVATMEIIRTIPAIGLAWEMVLTWTTRVQHVTCQLAYQATTVPTVSLFTVTMVNMAHVQPLF
jgi:hypothetical protein